MAKYRIDYSDRAADDIRKIKKSGNRTLNEKLIKLLEEILEHPRTGTGHPERLKGYTEDRWSRRINKEHRLVYETKEEVVLVLIVSAYGHYDGV